MNLERLTQIIDAYGANPEHWHIAEHDDAIKFLTNSTEAQKIQQQTLLLDNILDELPEITPTSALRTRILTTVTASKEIDILLYLKKLIFGTTFNQHILRPIVLILPLVIGIVIGLVDINANTEASPTDLLAYNDENFYLWNNLEDL
jgi:hypothetical protein